MVSDIRELAKFFEVFSPFHEQDFFYSRVRQEVVIIYLLYIPVSQKILTSSWTCPLPPMRSSREKNGKNMQVVEMRAVNTSRMPVTVLIQHLSHLFRLIVHDSDC